jgi:hypothetical protein
MSIEVIDTLVPKNNGDFAVVEDTHLLGGWRVVPDVATRNAIPDLRRKSGMVVFVISPPNEYQLGAGLTNDDWVLLSSLVLDANLSPLNRDMQAVATVSDNNLACPTAMFATPPANAWLQVQVNGVAYKVGNGTKTGVPCYFSGDGGVSARATGGVGAGDLLYWNGSIAGFQLDTGDRIDFLFESL